MIIDQHNAVNALYASLVPGASLVDGRTAIDKLSFLAHFGKLVNFYDSSNNINGNWSPFLLKDPVFLLAVIANTPIASIRTQFMQSVSAADIANNSDSESLSFHINNIFSGLFDAFDIVGTWSYYMQSSADYPLKEYTLNEIKNNWAPVYWALIALKNNLALHYPEAFTPFEKKGSVFSNDVTWTYNKNKLPYWQLLADKTERETTKSGSLLEPVACFNTIAANGDRFLNFVQSIVNEAAHAFEKIKEVKSRYPDTTLLRAFINLSEIHQQAMNKLAGKHLEYYYKKILHQSPLPAVPDKVFVYATLTGNSAAYPLPKDTLFNAGVDALGNPVSFALPKATTLNPAYINAAYTVSAIQQNNANKLTTLSLATIPDPGTIHTDADGMAMPWNTFGSNVNTDATVATSFIIASPMLLLNEGNRVVEIKFEISSVIENEIFEGADYFLSTTTTWIKLQVPVIAAKDINTASAGSEVCLKFVIPASSPAITSFPKNPEGLPGEWPMMKIQFNTYDDLLKPPVVTAITISVQVTGMLNLPVYNDYGALSTKAAYPLFGPMPVVNNEFIIGSAEIFSKPVTGLFFEMAWDKLPADFNTYYLAYNEYLQRQSDAAIASAELQEAKEKAKHRTFFQKLGNFFRKLASPFARIGKALKKAFRWVFNITDYPPDPPAGPYNNACFAVQFNALERKTWQKLSMSKVLLTTGIDGSIAIETYVPDTKCVPSDEEVARDEMLFTMVLNKDEDCVLADKSCFGSGLLYVPDMDNITPIINPVQPSIQNEPQEYSALSASGFVRMQLTAPVDGFGSAIYPNVVSDIALRNAALIIDKVSPDDLYPAANIPFVPKLVQLTAHYSAVQRYDLTSTQNDYPLSCYVSAPFQAGVLYTNKTGIACENTDANNNGVSLYPYFPFTGALFLQLKDVVWPSDIHLYFQLSASFGNIAGDNAPQFFYTDGDCWKPLTLLSEGTNNFSCPGIISLSFKDQPIVSAHNTCWIAIAVNDDVQSFSQTVLLQTNGLRLIRAGNGFTGSIIAPSLPAKSISQTVQPFPGIASVVQPFASYGGKAAETDTLMNQRVSNRIKTKDRAVSKEDFSRLILQEFPEVYYSKLVFDTQVKIYLVKKVNSAADANAFMPLVTECMESEVQRFLQSRMNPFATLSVANFSPEYLQVVTHIILSDGYDAATVSNTVNSAISIFLSPWISTTQQQVVIDQGINNAMIIAFINTIPGITSVSGVTFNRGDKIVYNIKDKKPVKFSGAVEMIYPKEANALFIPVKQHLIYVD